MPKRITHEDYIARLAERNPGVVCLETYVDDRTKLRHLCVCGEAWLVSPGVAYRGSKCASCGYRQLAATKTTSRTSYLQRLGEANTGVTCLGEFLGVNVNTLHRCACGTEWTVRPSVVLRGGKCRACGNRKTGNRLRKPTKSYDAKLKATGSGVTRIGMYKNYATPIVHRCRCGTAWKVSPSSALLGAHCRKCKNAKVSETSSIDQDEYDRRLKLKGSGILRSGPYTNHLSKISHVCPSCDREWMVKPSELIKPSHTGVCYACARSFKSVTLGDEVLWLQGFEPQAVQWLIDNGIAIAEDIITEQSGGVPTIAYELDGEARVFKPDIYVGRVDTIFEVKGLKTFGFTETFFGKSPEELFRQNQAKCRAAKASGFKCVFLIMTRKGERIALPKGWENMTHARVVRWLKGRT